MKRLSALFSITITIAAMSLITLPNEAFAANCDVESWNRALTNQQALERQYNFHARRFNQLAGMFNHQPFLHQEFVFEELVSFWQQEKKQLHGNLLDHITAAKETSSLIEQEIKEIASLLMPTTEHTQYWRAIHRECKRRNDPVNSTTSGQYLASNVQLIKALNQLIRQLTIAKESYEREVQTLENAQSVQQKRIEQLPN